MGTTFDVNGAVFSTLDRQRNRLRDNPFRGSATDIRRIVAQEKLKRNSSKVYRSTGDLLDDNEGALRAPKFPSISSSALSNMLSGRGNMREGAPVSSSAVQPIRQNVARPTLPALLEVADNAEDEFIRRVVNSETERLQFRLTPAFLVYMAARYYLSPFHRGSAADDQRRHRVRMFFLKVSERFRMISKDYRLASESMAFWLANSSELLNIMKQDKELAVITAGEPQQILTDAVESSFDLLCVNLKDRLRLTINSFIDTRVSDRAACSETIAALDDTMRLLRRCRLNIALTIQLFSQLFHFINAYLFNWLVSPAGSTYCSTAFGVRLRTRLRAIHEWAEQQGLELAAVCHMDRIQQAVTLLTTPKGMDQIANLGTTCYKLNSIQVRYLLEHIVLDVGEESVARELVESVVRLAETLADDMAKQDGTGVQLEEQLTLQLPFLLPQDGYSIDLLRAVPPSMAEYVTNLQSQGICCMVPQPSASGSWTVHFNDDIPNDPVLNDYPQDNRSVQMSSLPRSGLQNSRESHFVPVPESSSSFSSRNAVQCGFTQDSSRPSSVQTTPVYAEGRNPEIMLISLNRGASSIGLSIVAAQGIGERCVGIYIKKVVEGSVASRDGRLQPGDQLLSVNGQSLVGISQEEAAAKMGAAGPIITFEVNKRAARYNGLSDWLNCPPPTPTQMQQYSNFNQPSYGSSSNFSTLQSERQAPAYPQPGGHPQYARQNSVSSTTPSVYSTGGYSEKSNMHYGSVSVQPQQPTYNGTGHYGYGQTDVQLRTDNRSLSATELYQNLGPGSSTNSLVSLPPRQLGIPGAFSYTRGPAQSTGHPNLPSRYRVGLRDAIRPTVVQPSRPAASPRSTRRVVAPSPQICGSLPSTSGLMQQTRNASLSMPHYSYGNGHAVNGTDYVNVQYNDQFVPGPPSDTSFSSSASHSLSYAQNHVSTAKILPNTAQPMFPTVPCCPSPKYSTPYRDNGLQSTEYSQDSLNVPSSSSATDSRYGSNPSPSNAEVSSRPTVLEPLKKLNSFQAPSKRDELNEELDKLEMKGTAMTEADQRKYRQLVNELSKVREPLPVKAPARATKVEGFGDGHLTTTTSGKVNGDSDSRLHLDEVRTNGSSLQKARDLHTGSQHSGSAFSSLTKAHDKNSESLIGELQKEMHDLKVETPTAEVSKTIESSTNETEKNLKKKKGVQWDEENIETSTDETKHLVFKEEEEAEPRVQVLGTQEVYRDPRLRRLNEIQARRTASQPTVDGANLGFREKMRLFAEQAGEKSLKNRYKTSSAQREIEQSIE